MPWKLFIGDFSWIGEETWIDNLAPVKISKNVCISLQEYIFALEIIISKKESFDLICKPILIDDEVWIGAKSIICPGYKVGKGSVITIGSIIKNDIPSNSIFKENTILKFE